MAYKAAWEFALEILDREASMRLSELTDRLLKLSECPLCIHGGSTPSNTLGVELRNHPAIFYVPRRGVYALRRRLLKIRIRCQGTDWPATGRKLLNFLAQYEQGWQCWVRREVGFVETDDWLVEPPAVCPTSKVFEIMLTTTVDVPRWIREPERLTKEFLEANKIAADIQLGLIRWWPSPMWLKPGEN